MTLCVAAEGDLDAYTILHPFLSNSFLSLLLLAVNAHPRGRLRALPAPFSSGD